MWDNLYQSISKAQTLVRSQTGLKLCPEEMQVYLSFDHGGSYPPLSRIIQAMKVPTPTVNGRAGDEGPTAGDGQRPHPVRKSGG